MEIFNPTAGLLLLVLFTVALFVAVFFGLAFRGPIRPVKIGTLLLVLCFFACMTAFFGLRAAVFTFFFTLASTVVGVSAALCSWRFPVDGPLREAFAGDCPPFAWNRIEKWTRELTDAGFVHCSDRLGKWKLHGKERHTFMRFLRHPSDPVWVELHAIANPKVAARMVVSAKGQEGAVLTVDQQSDQEMLDDREVVVQRVPRKTSCLAMVNQHRVLASKTPGGYLSAEDPLQAHRWVFSRWAERLAAAGQVIKEEGLIRLPPLRLPRLMLRMCSAWFH